MMNEGEIIGIQGYHLKFLGLASPSLTPLHEVLSLQGCCSPLPSTCKSEAAWARLLLSPSRTGLLQESGTTVLSGHTGALLGNSGCEGGLWMWSLVSDTC